MTSTQPPLSRRPVFLRRALRRPLICVASIAVWGAVSAAYGQYIFKANNLDTLASESSWVGMVQPGPLEIATWDATVLGAQSLQLGTDLNWQGLRILNPGGAITIGGASVLTLGSSGIDLSHATQNLTVTSPVQLAFNQSWVVGEGRNLLVSGIISGFGTTLTKQGAGTLTLTAANTSSGPTSVSGGTLRLNFAAAGAPLADILHASSALQLGGGHLVMQGSSAGAVSQSFVSTTLTPGLSQVTVTNGAGGPATMALGTLSAPIANLGSVVRFHGPSTIDGAGPVAATGTITTLTAGAGGAALPFGNLGTFNTPGQVGGYATVGLYDFASTNLPESGGAGSAPYTIIGGSQVAGFYNSATPGNSTSIGNWDMVANSTLTGGEKRASTLRFNTPGANTLTLTSGSSSTLMTLNSILVTPNMGASNTTITAGAGTFIGAWQIIRATSPAGQQEGIIWQNNTQGFLNFNAGISDGRDAGDVNHIVKAGPGTYVPNLVAAGAYTGQTFLLEGVTLIGGNKDLGNMATGANLHLNGGVLMGNGTMSLDNAGVNLRPVVLGNQGGALAAVAGQTLTVPGVVSGLPGTGPLIIGHGLVAGSGVGTANPTEIIGSGKVVLSGANTHTGGTVVRGATLNINGIFALGGANYGGLTLHDGTLQYATTLISDGDVTVGRGLVVEGASGIDTNGQAVTFAAGVTGTGGLTKIGNGVLTLGSASNYTGGTTVNGGVLRLAALSGSATGSGSVTVNTGGTLGGTGSIGGALTINAGGTLEPGVGAGLLVAPSLLMAVDSLYRFELSAAATGDLVQVTNSNGLTMQGGKFSLFAVGTSNPWNVAGTYPLFSFAGAIQGAGISALSVQNPAAGYSYSFGSAGGMVTVTITAAGQISNWLATTGGSWGTAGNWSSGVPNQIGATANFGNTVAGPASIALDGMRTVGAITFDHTQPYTITAGTGGSLTLQVNTGTASLAVLSGSHGVAAPTMLASDTSVEVANGGSLAITGQLSGSRTLTKRGSGLLILGAANAHAATTLDEGIIEVGNNGALGVGTLTVSHSATLRAGAPALSAPNPVVLGNGVTVTVDSQAHTTTFTGAIGDMNGNGAVEKVGAGQVVLAGANTYGGKTTVLGGVLSVNDLQNGGLPSSLGQSSAAASNVYLNGSTLKYFGADGATDRLFTIGGGGATWDASGIGPIAFTATGALGMEDLNQPRTVVLTGTNTGANLFAPSLGNHGSGNTTLVKDGPGSWTLGGTNTFSGATIVMGGHLLLSNALALQNSTLDYANYGGSIGFDTIVTASVGGLQGGQNLELQNNLFGPVALTVGGNGATLTYGGVLSGPGSLTKIGNGSMILTGANTYNGSTTINGGNIRLATNDAISPASQTFVNIGGGLQLANGVTASNPITAAVGSGEFVDVPEAGASATLAGTLNTASGSHQYRLGISGAGATLTVTGAHTVGGVGTISFITRGNIVFAGNGSLNINTGNDTFQFGRFGGQALNLLLKDNASIVSGAMGFGGGQAGGAVTVTLQDNASITAALGKNFDFHGINANVPVTINLNGGTLTAGSFSKFQIVTGRESYLNFNGGTLRAGASNPNFLPALPGLVTNIQTGGGIIDTASFEVAILQPFTHDPLLGGTLDGGVIKRGEGTLILGGLNTYTGLTVVQTGNLIVTGTLSAGNSLVETGATLGGTGTLLGADVSGTLSPGLLGGTGTLQAEGTIHFLSGSSLAIDLLGLAVGGEYDQLNFAAGTGALSVSGGSLALTLGFAPSLGDRFTLVQQSSAAAINGAFVNAPDEGLLLAEYNGTSYVFRADYQGGDGNELTLTVVPEPSVPMVLCGGLALLVMGVRRRSRRIC